MTCYDNACIVERSKVRLVSVLIYKAPNVKKMNLVCHLDSPFLQYI